MPALAQKRYRQPDRRRTNRPLRWNPKRRRNQGFGGSELPEVPDWMFRVLTLYIPAGKKDSRKEHEWRRLTVALRRLPVWGSQMEFGDLASQIWLDGFCRFAKKQNAMSGVAREEKRSRDTAHSLAASARGVADWLERILRAKPGEDDFRLKALIGNALMQDVTEEAENGLTPVGSCLRFPSLIADLRSLSGGVEASLKSRARPEHDLETQWVNLESLHWAAFSGGKPSEDLTYPNLGSGAPTHKSIVDLLTDAKGRVHWSVWRTLLRLLHPTLRGKFDITELKRHANRLRATHVRGS